MAISAYFSAVNQKLLFARRLLSVGETVDDRYLHSAIAQSVVFQLQQALRWHLCDIAATYQLKEPEAATSVVGLLSLLHAADKAPAEASELKSLEADANSWLAELQRAGRELVQLPELRKVVMDVDRLPVLVADGKPPAIDWTLENVGGWLQALAELIDRQRDMMVEF